MPGGGGPADSASDDRPAQAHRAAPQARTPDPDPGQGIGLERYRSPNTASPTTLRTRVRHHHRDARAPSLSRGAWPDTVRRYRPRHDPGMQKGPPAQPSRPEPTIHGEPRSGKGTNDPSHHQKDVRRRPTLPHPTECSTIGAVELSYRVRNGTGRFPDAMTAVTRRDNQTPTTTPRKEDDRGSGIVLQEPHSGREHVTRQ